MCCTMKTKFGSPNLAKAIAAAEQRYPFLPVCTVF